MNNRNVSTQSIGIVDKEARGNVKSLLLYVGDLPVDGDGTVLVSGEFDRDERQVCRDVAVILASDSSQCQQPMFVVFLSQSSWDLVYKGCSSVDRFALARVVLGND